MAWSSIGKAVGSAKELAGDRGSLPALVLTGPQCQCRRRTMACFCPPCVEAGFCKQLIADLDRYQVVLFVRQTRESPLNLFTLISIYKTVKNDREMMYVVHKCIVLIFIKNLK